MQMQNSQHVDTPFLRMEVHATIHLIIHAWELSGIGYDTKEHLVKLFEKPRS